ncbi:MAG: endolytic transglycosylase MltG [Elusimicrobiaceae bacterium]|jgi:UPF0755 protein|nr:endolytic transglycosylase MltG [Elusimicrobiaceae bacterium]MBT3954676.1 endolytic transglycosylase MltG [Elusimicrobiaceae bacterium]MBT4007850.1 endolytic transglycosylase MltG [Elusimicrobiaceae bacterium]MBT4402871.1 endolytic transglycosylase MltG [Elusimicrobiaceae bacterium]MBT4440105.1 endolytic transglycosylase MltG [Elusimicrobiaceae bacterium]
MSKYFKVLSVSFTLVFLLIIYFYFIDSGSKAVFQVEPNQTGTQIAKNLKEKGIIDSELWFRAILKATGNAKNLKAGKYTLNKNISSEEALWVLLNQNGDEVFKITLLEGYRAEEIAEQLSKYNITDPHEFLRLVKQQNLEGKLFPSTYNFLEQMQPQKVIDMMMTEFNNQTNKLLDSAMCPLGLSKEEVITLASIVEREAVHDEERAKIASVYLNRLEIGKRLQADPTVQYALGYNVRQDKYWKKNVNFRDLTIKSPYNTYRNKGLPPSPICNPGYKSIKAVLQPEPNFRALYFVADIDGSHVFSETYHQHLKNIKQIKKNK